MYRLREQRKKQGLSLAQLSNMLEKTGLSLSPDSLSKYERGDREPKLKTWQKLANFFGVSVEYLMGLSDQPHITKNDTIDLSDLFDNSSELTIDGTKLNEYEVQMIQLFLKALCKDKKLGHRFE